MDTHDLDEAIALVAHVSHRLDFWPSRQSPDLIGAVRRWNAHADVLLLGFFRDKPVASAYRAVLDHPGTDVFNPDWIVWDWHGDPDWAVRQLLALAHPDHADAPIAWRVAPEACRVPRELRARGLMRPTGRQGGV